jgi:2-dehydropantoate 2-reductase
VRISIFGAGVIGRIYAARLLSAGHEVSILTRGAATDELRINGIHLVREGVNDIRVFSRVVEALGHAGHADLVFVAVRLDQINAALLSLGALGADVVASFINLPLGTVRLRQTIGADRFVSAFPGVAGLLGRQGTVHYVQVTQQPTTVGRGRAGDIVVSVLKSAGFPVATTKDMDAWLKTHVVFVSTFESALAAVSGDAHALASNSVAVRELVLAVREGFAALHSRGVSITPHALRIIFQTMPVRFATRYWCQQLDGELGRLALAPHSVASKHSELPVLQHRCGGSGRCRRRRSARDILRSSLGRTGVYWDNSQAEGFFSMLKNECLYRTVYATKTQARRDLIRNIGEFITAAVGTEHSATDAPTKSTMDISSQSWQRRRIHQFRCPKSSQQPRHHEPNEALEVPLPARKLRVCLFSLESQVVLNWWSRGDS